MNRKKREQLILDSALLVFKKKGYAQTSVSEIISAANVARGTFYLYFSNKKDVMNAWLDLLASEVFDAISEFCTSTLAEMDESQASPRQQLSGLVSVITKNRQIISLLLQQSHELHQETQQKIQLFFENISTLIQQQIEMRIERGRIHFCRSAMAARCLLGSIKEILATWVMDDTFNTEAAIDSISSFVRHGLGPMAANQSALPTELTPVTLPAVSNYH